MPQRLSAAAEKKMVAAIQSREEQNGCRRSWDPKFLQSRYAWRPSGALPNPAVAASDPRLSPNLGISFRMSTPTRNIGQELTWIYGPLSQTLQQQQQNWKREWHHRPERQQEVDCVPKTV